MNNYTFITLAAEEKGGLFDFGPTLPLIVIQFLVLLFVLNIILYNPLITLLEKRASNIVNQLTSASEILATGNDLIESYNNTLKTARAQSKENISLLDQEQNKLYDATLFKAKSDLNNVVSNVTDDLKYSQLDTFKSILLPETVRPLSQVFMEILFLNLALPIPPNGRNWV
jgi:F-type H+-transporting ATPase subunit b